jgi:hypothetical protein
MNKIEQIELINKKYPLYKNGTSNREIRHDFFKNIETELQAYLLGLHASDGSLDKVRNTFRIKMSDVDKETIDLYKIISPNARTFEVGNYSSIKTIRNRHIHTGNIYGIEINSIILINDLINLGFGFRKTYSENHLPDIPKHLIRHFIRGYFDGDGCITGHVKFPKPIELQKKKDIKQPCIKRSFQIDCKTKTLIEEINNLFNYNNITTNINYIKRDNMWRLCSADKKIIEKIFKLFYTNSEFYMSRKFKKFNYYVNTEVSQIISDTVTHRSEIISQEYGTS